MNQEYVQWLGYFSAALTVISLWTVKRWRVMWLVYSASSILFTILMLLTCVWGWAFAGLIFIVTGIKNYLES